MWYLAGALFVEGRRPVRRNERKTKISPVVKLFHKVEIVALIPVHGALDLWPRITATTLTSPREIEYSLNVERVSRFRCRVSFPFRA